MKRQSRPKRPSAKRTGSKRPAQTGNATITVAMPVCAPARSQVVNAMAPLQAKFGSAMDYEIKKIRNVSNQEAAKAGGEMMEADGKKYPVAQAVEIEVPKARAEWVEREMIKHDVIRPIGTALSKYNENLIKKRGEHSLPVQRDEKTGAMVPWSDGKCAGKQYHLEPAVRQQEQKREAPTWREVKGKAGGLPANASNRSVLPERAESRRPVAALPDKQMEAQQERGRMTAMWAAAAGRVKQAAQQAQNRGEQVQQARQQPAPRYEVTGKNDDGTLEATPAPQQATATSK